MSPPIQLITSTFPTPNHCKPVFVLEELGLQYTAKTIDISKNVQKEEWFLEINPNGRIPALVDDGLPMMESGAIMLYLTDKYDTSHRISYPHGTKEYYQVLQWVMFQMAGVGPMQGQASHFVKFAPEKIPYAIERYTNETKRLYGVLEKQLETNGTGWLVGDKMTIADLANFSWARPKWTTILDLDFGEFKRLSKWAAKIEALPSVQKGTEPLVEGLHN